jgi:hypothetical protein
MWPWKKKFKSYLIEDKYKIVEAFSFGGKRYLMYDNSLDVPTGRMFAAMAIYVEMEMRCDKEYLDLHTKAMEKLLNPADKRLNITYIAQLNLNLKDRLNLMPMPNFIYKLASVIFFDETESVYSYDFAYNEKKIEKWKKSPEMLDFFLTKLGAELIPFLNTAGKDTSTYMGVAEKINQIHLNDLTKVLSVNP